MIQPIDCRASALAQRVAAGKKTRLRTLAGRHAQFFTAEAVKRIAEMQAESPPEPLAYTLDGLATAFGISARAVLRRVERGAIPAPDLIIAGEPRWFASAIDPLLERRGVMPLEARLLADGRQASRDGANLELTRRRRAHE